jgi:hypothetical protein
LTIEAGINKAATTGGDLDIAAGTYSERIALASGVNLFGGFVAGTWPRDPAANVTRIAGGATAVTGSGVHDVTLDGLTITSADASTPGGSSTAVALAGSSNITLSNDIITAGQGAAGTSGADGAALNQASAPDGNLGGGGVVQLLSVFGLGLPSRHDHGDLHGRGHLG